MKEAGGEKGKTGKNGWGAGFTWLIVIWIAVASTSGGIRLLSGGDLNGEREGDIKWDDCREKIWHKERPWSDLLNIYTCSYDRNAESKVIGGTCARVEYPYFGTGCRTAHVYSRESEVKCAKGFYPDQAGTGCKQ
jgi:hypothetical protein